MHTHIWRRAYLKLVPVAAIFIFGAVISTVNGNLHKRGVDHKSLALIGVIIFVVFAVVFLHILSRAVRRLIAAHHLGVARAAALQFLLRIVGYVAIILSTMALLGIPIGHLLLGGAALGIILGVAAQQALANFFASIILILAHPFTVGEEITINSGALGGKFEGTVIDIGLTHTRMRDSKDNIVLLPNATLLSSASIIATVQKKTPAPSNNS